MPDAALPLKFKVAPHIVEDLGLNLYTSLPRAIAEFIANAHDADATYSKIMLDRKAIEKAREVLAKQYELECVEKKDSNELIVPLAQRVLPRNVTIVIEDDGHGMSRDDLNNKFLIAGRRRRQEEPSAGVCTPKQRLLMGRKGVGKLAGFGIAKFVEVTTRKEGESHATKIVLDYDDLVRKRATHEIEVKDEKLADGGGFTEKGTRVVLSGLLYDPVRSRDQTIENEIADHFALIDPKEFAVAINGKPIHSIAPAFAFGWPSPERQSNEFVEIPVPGTSGNKMTFRYRIRFTGKNEALPAARRGVRVYVHHRLAALPSLLNADTNMHGFRMTDYMDGVVHANFIDEQETDYIATDRQSLRWDTPLLEPLFDFLSSEIKEACKHYQAKRDKDAREEVAMDDFTITEVTKCNFSKRDEKMALRFAAILEGACKRGVSDPVYKTKLPSLIKSIGHGNVLTAISQLAEQDHPELAAVAVQIAKLTKDELGQFISSANARLKGILALKKVVEAHDFQGSKQEKLVQKMYEDSPWLINPTYSQFLTANQSVDTVFTRLAKELKVANYAPSDVAADDEDRPDLVFLLGSESLNRLIIVELKAVNVALEDKHLTQLYDYMQKAEDWMKAQDRNVKVEGQLIGSLASPTSRARGVNALRRRINERGPESAWVVRDFISVVSETEAAHKELIDIYNKAEQSFTIDDENENG